MIFIIFLKLNQTNSIQFISEKKGNSVEEILDINQLSKGLDFYQISGISPSA